MDRRTRMPAGWDRAAVPSFRAGHRPTAVPDQIAWRRAIARASLPSRPALPRVAAPVRPLIFLRASPSSRRGLLRVARLVPSFFVGTGRFFQVGDEGVLQSSAAALIDQVLRDADGKHSSLVHQ